MSATSSLTIRTAVDADGPGIRALIAGVFAEYEDCPFVDAEFPELAAPATHFAAHDGALWVVTEGDRVIGSLAVARTVRPDVFELFKVYLAAGMRGRGLAATLLGLAEDHARARGGHRLVLWSDTRFTAGHRFYQRHGFERFPGTRALHDAARSLEFGFSRAIAGRAGA
ncbi:N-acetyltransferase family protein [Alsobacter sp. R-9]